jgi:hypothetical protein
VAQTSVWTRALYDAVSQINVNQGAWTPTVLIARGSVSHGAVSLPNGWKLDDVPLSPRMVGSSDSDAHAIVVDAKRNREYDLFRLRRDGGQWAAGAGVVLQLDGSGWYDGTYCVKRLCGPWGARASSAALGGGLIRPSEIKQDVVPHALACAAPKQLIGPPVPPATTSDGTGGRGAMPMGSRLQLDPSIEVGALGLESGEAAIARALQRFGAYIVDSTDAYTFACFASNSSTLDPWPYPATWANGITKELFTRMRVISPATPPSYDHRAVFNQPHR